MVNTITEFLTICNNFYMVFPSFLYPNGGKLAKRVEISWDVGLFSLPKWRKISEKIELILNKAFIYQILFQFFSETI